MGYAVKITITAGNNSGTKFVTRNSGLVRTVETVAQAEALIEKCKKSAITGVAESYEIVERA